ncbi:MAG: hypothetical protein M1838_001101 [Thelocarpon superellum]|nr:MAG: hypothetical protein M1838_001101 [Thelocarpon superellum]
MAGVKRPRDSGPVDEPTVVSPYMSMFEAFRDELDEHHDRRERTIKAARDITALSKKMIFSLQRIRHLHRQIPKPIAAENAERAATIAKLFTSIVEDVRGINAWRYRRQISGGIQEFVEAVSLEHYLTTQRLISLDEADQRLPAGVQLTEDDYVLGLFDLVGELMRFAITSMATSGSLPRAQRSTPAAAAGSKNSMSHDLHAAGRDILTDLRSLRSAFESLDTSSSGRNAGLGKEMEQKMGVMKTCVEKVENAAYGMIIRGRERPTGWLPDLREDSGGGAESIAG